MNSVIARWILYVVSLLASGPFQDAETPSVVVTGRSQKEKYLFGEPLLLEFTFKNTGTESIALQMVHEPNPYQDVRIMLSRDGIDFVRYRPVGYDDIKVRRRRHSIAPGECFSFDLRMLRCPSTDTSPQVLAPGKVFVKVVYPLYGPSSDKVTRSATSNVVEAVIQPPNDREKVLLEFLREEHISRVMEHGTGTADQVMRLADHLERHRDSAYRSAMWDALNECFWVDRGELSPAQKVRLRKVLGIQPIDQVDDQRLDTFVRRIPDQDMCTEKLVALLAERSGIDLSVPPGMAHRRIRLSIANVTLRQCLSSISYQLHAPWVKRSNGYEISRLPKDP